MKNKTLIQNVKPSRISQEHQLLQRLLYKHDRDNYTNASGIPFVNLKFMSFTDSSDEFFLEDKNTFTTIEQKFIYTLCRNVYNSTMANAWVKVNPALVKSKYGISDIDIKSILAELERRQFISVRRSMLFIDQYFVQFNYHKLFKCKLKYSGFLKGILVDRENKDASIGAVLEGDKLFSFITNRLLELVKRDIIIP